MSIATCKTHQLPIDPQCPVCAFRDQRTKEPSRFDAGYVVGYNGGRATTTHPDYMEGYKQGRLATVRRRQMDTKHQRRYNDELPPSVP